MGNSSDNETTLLISHTSPPTTPLKFPLGLVSESVRPYLELIRLEKVRTRGSSVWLSILMFFTADRNHSYVLALRYVTS